MPTACQLHLTRVSIIVQTPFHTWTTISRWKASWFVAFWPDPEAEMKARTPQASASDGGINGKTYHLNRRMMRCRLIG